MIATDRQIDTWERQAQNFETVTLSSDEFKSLLNRLTVETERADKYESAFRNLNDFVRGEQAALSGEE